MPTELDPTVPLWGPGTSSFCKCSHVPNQLLTFLPSKCLIVAGKTIFAQFLIFFLTSKTLYWGISFIIKTSKVTHYQFHFKHIHRLSVPHIKWLGPKVFVILNFQIFSYTKWGILGMGPKYEHQINSSCFLHVLSTLKGNRVFFSNFVQKTVLYGIFHLPVITVQRVWNFGAFQTMKL